MFMGNYTSDHTANSLQDLKYYSNIDGIHNYYSNSVKMLHFTANIQAWGGLAERDATVPESCAGE